jgi:hypothetical protein
MLDLQGPQLRVYFSEDIAVPRARLLINSGTEPATGLGFAPNAYVPKCDWRPLRDDEWALLQGTETSGQIAGDTPSALLVWKLPSSLLEPFKFIPAGIAKKNKTYIAENLLTHPDSRRAENNLLNFLWNQGLRAGLRILGHCHQAPGAITSGIRGDGKRVGLHIDSWAGGAAGARTGFPTRLCLNLGPEPRFLMFANLDVKNMIAACPELEAVVDANEVVTEFMRLNPNYPIVKIQVNPGEVYVAPTEVILHDGSCAGKAFVDAQTTLLGPFTFNAIRRVFTFESTQLQVSV